MGPVTEQQAVPGLPGPPLDLRRCTKCGVEKPRSEFRIKSGNKDRLSTQCRSCERAYNRAYYADNKSSIAAKHSSWLQDNAESVREYERRYYSENRDEILNRKAAMRAADPDRYREYGRRAARKRLSTPQGRLVAATKTGINRGIRPGSKGGRSTFALLGFTAEDLRAHLESQFAPGMTWENYGMYGWHVDHHVPLSAFDYETPDDQGFKAAWALSNLKPLWANDNWSKSDKMPTIH